MCYDSMNMWSSMKWHFWNALEFNFITSLSALLTRSNFNQPTVLIEQSHLPRDSGNDITAPLHLFKAQHSWSAWHSTGSASETMVSKEVHFIILLTTGLLEIQISKQDHQDCSHPTRRWEEKTDFGAKYSGLSVLGLLIERSLIFISSER